MRRRSLAREFALQILYKIDITGEEVKPCIEDFWRLNTEAEAESSVKAFASDLVRGVITNLKVIDEYVSRYATNWQLNRMSYIDRNILRLGCFEIIFRDDIPLKVSINEAVELAKKYSSPEASKFVNGILDKIKLEKK